MLFSLSGSVLVQQLKSFLVEGPIADSNLDTSKLYLLLINN